jgi:hypothetical protein
MSVPTTTTYDVFLSYPITEAGIADTVTHALERAGLDVFDASKSQTPEEGVHDVIWRAVAESSALIVVVPSEGPLPSSVALEVGAFKAWCKPIYVIQTVPGRIKLPMYIADSPVYPLSRVDDVVESIKRGMTSLSENERNALMEAYQQLALPLDKLLMNPAAIDQLAKDFNTRCGRQVSGERLVRELLNMRKAGRLHRLGRWPR